MGNLCESTMSVKANVKLQNSSTHPEADDGLMVKVLESPEDEVG